MIKCESCGRNFKNNNGLSIHNRSSKTCAQLKQITVMTSDISLTSKPSLVNNSIQPLPDEHKKQIMVQIPPLSNDEQKVTKNQKLSFNKQTFVQIPPPSIKPTPSPAEQKPQQIALPPIESNQIPKLIQETYILPPPSQEQQQIIEATKRNVNLIIDSVAGSGKTTTCLHISKASQNKRILLLTYNARLKEDTRKKVTTLKIVNCEVHSYNAFCVKYYDRKGYHNEAIRNVVNNDNPQLRPFQYDMIILDEQQDMTEIFFKFVIKIIKDNTNSNIQICLFGDIFQNIYSHSGSDERYLTFSPSIFSSPNKWETYKISTSYRITNQMALFINQNLLKFDRLQATKNGEKVKYIIDDLFHTNKVFMLIKEYLNTGYKPDDIFVLAASVRCGTNLSPIRILENNLVKNGIACNVSLSDEAKIDDEVLKGKISFATFHQVKGMERKICIIYGFDDSYFDYYGKDLARDKCPNVLYVALTRAKEKLVLLHNSGNKFMQFIDIDNLCKTCTVLKYKRCELQEPRESYDKSVTQLIRSLSMYQYDYIFNLVKHKTVREKNNVMVPINNKIKSLVESSYEDVSDINGLAIPAYYEYVCNDTMEILRLIVKHINSDGNCSVGICKQLKLGDKHKKRIMDLVIKEDKLDIKDVLYISNVYRALCDGYIFRIDQITLYNWISDGNMGVMCDIMRKYVDKNAVYEFSVEMKWEKCDISGRIDCVDNNTIWEFKCVGELTKSHILQLVIYSYMYERSLKDRIIFELCEICGNKIDVSVLLNDFDIRWVDTMITLIKTEFSNANVGHLEILKSQYMTQRSYKLINILSEEIIEVEYDPNYVHIIDYLMNISSGVKMSDDEFIKKCVVVRDKIMGTKVQECENEVEYDLECDFEDDGIEIDYDVNMFI